MRISIYYYYCKHPKAINKWTINLKFAADLKNIKTPAGFIRSNDQMISKKKKVHKKTQ